MVLGKIRKLLFFNTVASKNDFLPFITKYKSIVSIYVLLQSGTESKSNAYLLGLLNQTLVWDPILESEILSVTVALIRNFIS